MSVPFLDYFYKKEDKQLDLSPIDEDKATDETNLSSENKILAVDSFEAELLDGSSEELSLEKKIEQDEILLKNISEEKLKIDTKISQHSKQLEEIQLKLKKFGSSKSARAKKESLVKKLDAKNDLLESYRKQSKQFQFKINETKARISNLKDSKSAITDIPKI